MYKRCNSNFIRKSYKRQFQYINAAKPINTVTAILYENPDSRLDFNRIGVGFQMEFFYQMI